MTALLVIVLVVAAGLGLSVILHEWWTDRRDARKLADERSRCVLTAPPERQYFDVTPDVAYAMGSRYFCYRCGCVFTDKPAKCHCGCSRFDALPQPKDGVNAYTG